MAVEGISRTSVETTVQLVTDDSVTVESVRLKLPSSLPEAGLPTNCGVIVETPDEEMEKDIIHSTGKDEKTIGADTEAAKNLTSQEGVSSTTTDEKFKTRKEKTVTLFKEGADDDDDDIILLDEEETEARNSKRPRQDEVEDDDIMEVDGNGLMSRADVDVELAGRIIRKMKRQDLEDLILAKIVEGIVAHTEVGKLRATVLELKMQKDKMVNKMSVMMKQVAELSDVMTSITENEKREPKNRKPPHAIRFNRSVGLQTSLEPSVRTAPPTIIRVPEQERSGAKQSTGNSNGTFSVPQSQPVKRTYQGSRTSGDNKPTASKIPALEPVATGGGPRKVHSSQPSTTSQVPQRPLPIVPKTKNATTSPVSQSEDIVDLTDDDIDETPRSASLNRTAAAVTSSSPSGSSTATTVIDGIQYNILNHSSGSAASSVQLVPTSAMPKYVNALAQPRQVLVQQKMANNQSVVFKDVQHNGPPVTIVHPMPRQGNIAANGNQRVAATIPIRPATGSALGTNLNSRRTFILPALPPTPAPKVRNDSLKAPPKPKLELKEQPDGIVLSWDLASVSNMAEVTIYQIFACQEYLASNSNKQTAWKRVGDVKALPLPMACTLSQFTEENRYYFIVRGIDVFGRVGPFCDPQNILLRLRK